MITLIFAMSYQDFYRAYKDAEELFRKGDYSKSEKIYRKILRDSYKYGFGNETRYRIAEALFNQGKFDDAIREWDKLSKERT